jgi:S-formylglutathione hydrolase FrmB
MHIMLVEDVNDPLLVVRGEAARFESLLKAAAIPATLSIVPGSHSLGFAATQFPAITGFLEASWAGAMVRPAMLRP